MPGVLFQKDPFTRTSPQFRAPQKKKSGIVQEFYSDATGAVFTIRQLKSNEINSQNFKIDAANGSFSLKAFKISAQKTESQWLARLELMKNAVRAGVRLPRICRTNNGELWASHQGEHWILTEFASGTYYDGGEASLYDIGAELSRLFEYLSRQKGEFGKRGFFEAADLEAIKLFRQARKTGSSIEKVFAQDRKKIDREIKSATLFWQKLKKKPMSLCHIDIHPHNILVDKESCSCILDPGSILYSYRVTALGYGAFKLMRNLMAKGKKTPAQVAKIRKRFIESLGEAGNGDLKQGAKMELLKRYLFLAREYFKFGKTDWIHFQKPFSRGFEEIDVLFKG